MLKRFYGVGDCGFTLMSNIESYYFSFFLTNLAHYYIQYGRRSSFLDLRGDPQ